MIGPDFNFSLMELGLVNGILGAILRAAFTGENMTLFYAGLSILCLHDVFFAATIMCN